MQNKYATFLCCLIMTIFGMGITFISPLLVEISKTFSLSMAQTGLFFSFNYMGFILFVFLGAFLVHKYGKKKTIAISMLGLSLTFLLFGSAVNVAFAFATYFFVGGFGGLTESVVSALIADLNELNKEYYLNLSQIYLCFGAIIGPILTIGTNLAGGDWRASYFILSILSIIVLFMFSRIEIKESQVTNKVEIRAIRETLSDKKFLLICVCIGFYAGAEVGVWGWMSTSMTKDLGASVGESAAICCVFWVAMAVGRVICGKLTRFFKVSTLTAFLAFISAIVVALSGITSNEACKFVLAILTGLCFSSLYPFILAIGSEIKSSTLRFSILFGSTGLGAVIVPLLMGIIGDYFSFRIAMMSPAVLLLIVAVCIVLQFRSANDYHVVIKESNHKVRVESL